MGKSYKSRLRIPLEGNDVLKFFTKSCTHIATGYTRVVIGGRGPYVEFCQNQIVEYNVAMDPEEFYRTEDKRVYYLDLRSNDAAHVKIYLQKKTVAYADYKIGMCYISPSDLLLKDKTRVIV